MVVIIEGPNRCGKSTQIQNIKDLFESKGKDVQVIHYEHLHLDPTKLYTPEQQKELSQVRYDDMLHLADLFANDKKTLLIFDRAHLGEMVYGPKYRHYDGEYVCELEKKYEKLMAAATVFVFVDKPENLLSREDGLSPTTTLEDKAYETSSFVSAFVKSNIYHRYLINIEGQDAEAVKKQVYEFLNDRFGILEE